MFAQVSTVMRVWIGEVNYLSDAGLREQRGCQVVAAFPSTCGWHQDNH
jgi:putative hemolysin